ncbi:zinc finger protein 518B [Sorex araneus]|uniref:zinc finger protein 518B n=1 Tax=Sorex araneus TaxID=42254 RepID=UPI002433FA06|nr:zinc finger protein 518B [Sorex araneus]
MDSRAMQIKKMKDLGQQLYPAHASDGRGPATMSPKSLGAHRTARALRPEPPGLVYPGSEAEATLTTLATCAKCKGVQEIPIQELKKTQRADKYICFQCTLSMAPPPFPFGSGSPSGLRGKAAELGPGAGSNKFKVRNFKPGKYYCDKCRFSTKDPLQYKKHITQHDEIRFICSHCSYVSYTKGEFQRHLVKHTGIFPYQCEYCDYGAVRNDYIVKHRKRVHERAGGRRPPGPPAKLEAKRAGAAKPYPELGKTPGLRREALSGRLSDPLSKYPAHARKDKAHGVPWLPDPKDFQKDVVCIPKRLSPAEPSEMPLFENKSVEVEVLSPTREPLQPGMPLTVVAPSELVVPANCLAQLMDVKVVNGTQQVLLKLFPLEENSGLEARPCDGVASEQGAKDRGPGEPGQGGSVEPTRAPAGDGRVERLAAGMRHLPAALQKLRSMKWLRSYDLLMSHPGAHGPSEPPAATEDLQERGALCPYQASLPSLAFKGPFPPASMVKNSVFCGLGAGPGPFPYKAAAAAALAEERPPLARDSKRLLPLSAPPLALPFSGEQCLLPRGKGDPECRRKLSAPGKGTPSGRKLQDSPPEPSSVGPAPAQSQSECLQISQAEEGTAAPQQPGDGPLELTTAERTPESFEGPVISSVFSLSSGSEDVPEGIRWNSSTSKVKSVELLRRKIAKLIESCGRPSSLASSGPRGHPAGPASKALSKAVPKEIQEISAAVAGPSYASASPPGPREEHAVEGPPPHTQAYPQTAMGSGGKAEGRGGRRAHAATPALVSKGAALRALNSSKDVPIVEAACDTPGTVPHSEAQLSQPETSRPARQTDTDLQCPVSEGRSGGLGPTPDTALRPKPRKESAMCGVAPRRNGALYQGPQGLGDSGRHRKLLSRSLPLSKSKSRQGNAGKKKGQGQAELGRYLKDPSIFQVARQLRLVAAKPDQLIKCPRRNQPVIVLNHPDVDSPEVTNVMKVINKYKGNVLKVVLSERTRCQLGIRRHHVRLTYQNAEEANQIKRQMMLKMKLKKVHKNNYQVVDALPDDSTQCLFKCWFCGRLYEDQEEWMSHGQRHLIEATRDWDVLSSKGK